MTSLTFYCNGLTPEVIKKAEVELGETEEVRIQGLKELKRLIREERDLHSLLSDTFLLRFLRTRKFNVEKAFENLKNYYEFKARYSGFLTDFKPSDVKTLLEEGHSYVLEYRKDYAPVGFVKVADYDISKYSGDDIIAFGLVCGEVALMSEVTQISGYIVVADLTGCTWRTARHYISPTRMVRMVNYVQKCIPCRAKAIHILNAPSFAQFFVKIIFSMISEKLAQRVFMHSNLESFHKHISPEILPEEYGGTAGPVQKMQEKYISTVLTFEDHFNKVNTFGYQGKTLIKLKSG